MKTCLTVLIMGLAGSLGLGLPDIRAAVEFSAGLEIHATADFYAPLAPYGAWVTIGSYGRCWRPIHVEADWRPYCYGQWEWTDCGWYWESGEPWAWACYHYGSWVFDPNYGWLWIPGTEWAPAWVVWRESDDYIGWAPCGPGGVVVAPSLFVFVDFHHFRDPIRPRTVIVNNTTIINRTRVINNIRRETLRFDGVAQRVVINRGPGVDPIQRATGAKFTPRPITEVVRQTPVPETIKRNRSALAGVERQIQGQPREPTGRERQRIYQQPQPPPAQQEPPPGAIRPPQPKPVPETPDQRRAPEQWREKDAPHHAQPPARETRPQSSPPEKQQDKNRDQGPP